MPAALPPGKNPVSFEYEAGWTPKRLWTFWSRKKSLSTTGILTLEFLAHSTVGIPTVPSQPLPLQVIYGYIHKVPAEINYISFNLYASSVLDKFIKFVLDVNTELSPASSKPDTMDGSL